MRKYKEKFTILDHIDDIKVQGDVFSKPKNEYWALLSLRDGLTFIYRQAVKCEEVVRKQVNINGMLKVTCFGNLTELKSVPQGLLTCSFHWYAVTACNYVRLVGAIAYQQDKTRPLPPDYVKSVIPDVLIFRNKVAAHFAWATKNPKDNDAQRADSIMPSLMFVDDTFTISSWTLTIRRDGKTVSTGSTRPWSIYKVHRRLCERYWPEQIQKMIGLKKGE